MRIPPAVGKDPVELQALNMRSSSNAASKSAAIRQEFRAELKEIAVLRATGRIRLRSETLPLTNLGWSEKTCCPPKSLVAQLSLRYPLRRWFPLTGIRRLTQSRTP